MINHHIDGGDAVGAGAIFINFIRLDGWCELFVVLPRRRFFLGRPVFEIILDCTVRHDDADVGDNDDLGDSWCWVAVVEEEENDGDVDGVDDIDTRSSSAIASWIAFSSWEFNFRLLFREKRFELLEIDSKVVSILSIW